MAAFGLLHGDESVSSLPDDGHTLVLLEAGVGQRTFRDYPNTTALFENLLAMFETEKSIGQLSCPSYDLSVVFDWIDEFNNIQVFIFDKSTSRYRELNRTQIKEYFAHKAQEQSD